MIAIKSKKKFQFPPSSTGFIKMEIDLIQNKPIEEVYELRIIDSCFDTVLENQLKPDFDSFGSDGTPKIPTDADYQEVSVVKTYGSNTRISKFSYNELREMAKYLNIDFSDNKKALDNINELFRKGLLLSVQTDCQKGISGPGTGAYFSKATDWELV